MAARKSLNRIADQMHHEAVDAVVKRGRGRPRKVYTCAECAAVESDGRVAHEPNCGEGRAKVKATKSAVAPQAATEAPPGSVRQWRHPAQVVIMTDVDLAAAPRVWAEKLGRPQADLLREIYAAGVAAMGERWASTHGNPSRATVKRARDHTQALADKRTTRRREETRERRSAA